MNFFKPGELVVEISDLWFTAPNVVPGIVVESSDKIVEIRYPYYTISIHATNIFQHAPISRSRLTQWMQEAVSRERSRLSASDVGYIVNKIMEITRDFSQDIMSCENRPEMET